MTLSAADSYLETQVLTATPQRLRLMLIDEALRRVRSADEAFSAGRTMEGSVACSRAREIISELIAGVHPDANEVAKRVLGIYLYLFSTLTEAGLSADRNRLRDITRVLDEERQTWQVVCEQLPERPVASGLDKPAEEVAPAIVAPHFSPSYAAGQATGGAVSAAESFSMDA
jgi:flagellar secretion chaperone FliS